MEVWIIKFVFKYDYSMNKNYLGSHENKYVIYYRWEFIDLYILIEWCMLRWIQMTDVELDQ